MLNTSFKVFGEIYSKIPKFIPGEFRFTAYKELITETKFLLNLKNTVIVSIIVTVSCVFMSSLAAFAIARLNFKFRKGISKSIFFAYLIPRMILYIPLFILNVNLGVTDSLIGLMVIYPTFVIPYATWMLIAYFKAIPKELDEAAIIDGATWPQVIFKVVYPVSLPGVFSTAILAFTLCWGEYLYALINIRSDNLKTVPLGLASLIVGDMFPWGKLTAGAIIASIPILMLYFISNRYIESGLVAGSVKG